MKQVTLEGFLKKHRDISRTITKSNMELFVALVISFQPLTNFTMNLNIDGMGVLNVLSPKVLNTITYSEICACDQIKYCRTVACKFSKDNLFHRLMNYLNSSSGCICIWYTMIKSTPRLQLFILHACWGGISSYLAKQTFFTSKFSVSHWIPSFNSTFILPFYWNNCYLFVVRFYDFFLT